MTTKPKRRLDGTPRLHPSRERRGWAVDGLVRRGPNARMGPESTATARRNYHAYHTLENQQARTRATQDLNLMRKVKREPWRKSVTEWRLKHYEEVKKNEGARK